MREEGENHLPSSRGGDREAAVTPSNRGRNSALQSKRLQDVEHRIRNILSQVSEDNDREIRMKPNTG